jgi:hypothetical protein
MKLMTVQSTRKAGALRRLVLAGAAVGYAGALLLDPGSAFAGSCKKTQRITQRVATDGIPVMTVQTVVRDEAKYRNYDVVMMKDDKEFKSGTILATGLKTKISGSAWSGKQSTFKITISPAGEEEVVSTCTYEVSIGTKGMDATSTWRLTDGADSPCSGPINISCDKSYRDGSGAWKTTLVITD